MHPSVICLLTAVRPSPCHTRALCPATNEQAEGHEELGRLLQTKAKDYRRAEKEFKVGSSAPCACAMPRAAFCAFLTGISTTSASSAVKLVRIAWLQMAVALSGGAPSAALLGALGMCQVSQGNLQASGWSRKMALKTD